MAINTVTDKKQSQKSKAGLSDNPLLDLDVSELQHTLKLAGLLQTSLEPENILQYFLDSVSEKVSFSGVEYTFAGQNIALTFGKPNRHSCTYQLQITGENFGELKFSRNTRFSEAEMEQLEHFIYQLVYPLRNALNYQQALHAAQVDALTGINNRAALDHTLEREVKRAHRHDHNLSVLIIDVDHFKRINDTLGHRAGDAVLKGLVACIQETMRNSDMLFRYGGEEFALVLSDTDLDGACQVGERLRTAVSGYEFIHNSETIDLTISIGVAELDIHDDVMQLFDRADKALYCAKQSGRNQVVCQPEILLEEG